jgi:Protein of unknown function (DUF1360)
MLDTRQLQDRGPLAGHSPGQERPLGAYGLLTGLFAALSGAFATWFARSGRPLPESVPVEDLALVTVATHKLSRTLAKDRVTSSVRAPFTRHEGDAGPGEVNEVPRGRGLRRAVGELIVCPYCLALWIAAGFTAGLLIAPRATRWTASVFVALTGSDLLQIAYVKAEETL